jgi:peroxiredoxin (alkyl hydroperoxide reductase subunit C)
VSVLAPGTPAPEFTLRDEAGQPFTRADLTGHTTVLVFYPFAFTSVCTDQLTLYQEVLPEIEAARARIYGVSCDTGHSQKAFREQLGVTIPQLSDFEPKGATCRAFGVLHPGGFAERALVILGPDGVVRWSHQADSLDELPGVNLLFDGIAAVAA